MIEPIDGWLCVARERLHWCSLLFIVQGWVVCGVMILRTGNFVRYFVDGMVWSFCSFCFWECGGYASVLFGGLGGFG